MAGKRFFAWVWRVNSLIVFAVGLAGIIVLALAAFAITSDLTGTRHVEGVVNVAEEQAEGTTASLGSFSEVEGTELLRAPLDVHQEYGLAVGSKETSSTRKYLFFNPTSQQSYWLIPGYRGLIVEEKKYPSQDYDETNEPARVVVYELVENDSNHDERLTQEDTKTIAVSDPSGKNFVRVLNNVEEFKGGRLVGDTTLVVLYTSGTDLHAAEIDLATNKLTRESLLKPDPVEAPLGASTP